MKSKIKKVALIVLCVFSMFFILLVPIYLDKNNFSEAIYKSLYGTSIIMGTFLMLGLVAFLAVIIMALIVSLVKPTDKETTNQKE